MIDPGSTVTTQLRLFRRDVELAIGTGFFHRWNDQLYLITAWHNVSGRDPVTLEALSEHQGIPDRLKYCAWVKGHIGETISIDLNLYEDAGGSGDPERPVWLEHHVHGRKVDVIAIPISLPDGAEVRTIDLVDTASRMLLRVSIDVFVLGYPKGISGGGNFPIWKRASIATEPDIQHDGLPKLLVDTATRQGMSGAPVVAVAHKGFEVEDARFMPMSDHGYRFVGVYSGRVGVGEMEAQLGIVWKAAVVGEVVQVPTKGPSSFYL
jgi:hypothetical protein